MSDTVERPISLQTTPKETFADIARPEGSYNGAHALADDEVREQLGKKSEYPLHVANKNAAETLSERDKEARARDFAGEKGTIPRDMKTHLGPHPNWKSTDIPYSSLAPEVVSEKEEKNRQ